MSHLYADNDHNHLDNDHYCQHNDVICSIDEMMLTYVDFKIETGFSIVLKIQLHLIKFKRNFPKISKKTFRKL